MADNWRDQLSREYQQQRQYIERKVQSQRQAVTEAANKARTNLKGQLSDLEREAEAAINQIRKAEALEQRKRSLPLTRPKDIQAKERIAGLNRQRADIQKAIGKAKEDIAYAESQDLDAVKAAESSAMAELDRAMRRAEREGAKAEAEYKTALTDIQTNYVEVKDGYISKTDYEGLSANDQVLVKRLGVDYFNQAKAKQIERAEAQFDLRNVKLDNGEYVSKVEFDKLDISAQQYLQQNGVARFNRWAKKRAEAVTITTSGMVFSSPTAEANYYFKELQDSGDIPKDAKLEGYDQKTGEVNYSVPPPVLDDYIAKWRAAGMSEAEIAVITPLHKFSDMITYTFSDTDTRTVVSSLRQTFSRERRAKDPIGYWSDVGAMTAMVAVPFLWTTQAKQMSTHAIVANTLVDLAYIASIVGGAALRGLKTRGIMNTAKTAGKAATTMDKALAELAKTSPDSPKYASIVNKVNKAIFGDTKGGAIDMSQPLKTQKLKGVRIGSLEADRRFIAQLEKFRLTPYELGKVEKYSKIKGLKSAVLEVYKAQTQLDKAWNKIEKIGVKYGKNSPQYIRALQGVHDFKTGRVITPGVVTQAQTRLTVALEVFNTKLQPRYKFSPTPEFKGFATEWRQKMLPVFIEGEPDIKPLTTKGKGVQLAVIEKTKPKVEIKTVHELKLKPVYTEKVTPKTKVKLPKGKTAKKTTPVVKTVAPTKEKVEYEPGYQQRKYDRPDIRDLEDQASEVIGIPMTGTTLKIGGKTAIQLTPAEVTAVNIKLLDITREAIKAANKAIEANLTQNQVRQAVLTSVNNQIRAVTLEKVKQVLESKAKTIVTTVTKLTIKIPPKLMPPKVELPDGKIHTMTKKELAGAVGWKQGFIYKMIFPPYGKNNIVNSRKPIPGIKYYDGARSAYKSIVRLGGKLPKTIERDMGIMDITITTPKGGQPKIAFSPDILQRTTRTRGKRKPKRKGQRSSTTPSLSTARF